MERLKQLFRHAAETVDQFGRPWLWIVVSLVTLVIVAWLNPAKIGAYLWILSKLTLAACLGYVFDLGANPGTNPNALEGIERSMAQSRRALLIGLTVLAAGLMP